MENLKTKMRDREEFGARELSTRSDSIKSQLFNQFDELKPEGKVLEVDIDSETRGTYIRSLASKYNKEAAEDVQLHTKVDTKKKKAYIFASNVN